MRVIPLSDLPPESQQLSVIHFKERSRYKRLATALERTLTSCSEMHAEYESHTLTLRENSQKEGFIAGFELFITQLIHFFDDYEKQQNKRLSTLRTTVLNSIKGSFHDTVIVERIIHNLQVQCNQQKPLQIIIPRAVKLPQNIDNSNYIFSDDNNITIQNNMDSIRFPIDSVCQKWLMQADKATSPLSQEMAKLVPKLLLTIINNVTQHNENLVSNERSNTLENKK